VLVDMTSVEVFAERCLATITEQIFPSSASDGCGLEAIGGAVRIEMLEVFAVEPTPSGLGNSIGVPPAQSWWSTEDQPAVTASNGPISARAGSVRDHTKSGAITSIPESARKRHLGERSRKRSASCLSGSVESQKSQRSRMAPQAMCHRE